MFNTRRFYQNGLNFCILVFLLSSHAQADIWYVDKTAPGPAHDGDTWTTAYVTVQEAINVANSGDEIWVAAGSYMQNLSNRLVGTVAVDVALYGGFPTGGGLWIQRQPGTYQTYLQGAGGAPVLLISGGAGSGTIVDGFYITGGKNTIHGGGIKISESAPIIRNNYIYANSCDGAGAGISIWNIKIFPLPAEVPQILNNVILQNYALNDEGDGGGIAVINSAPIICGNYLFFNEATRNGGGIACWRSSQPLITNNIIMGNAASMPLSEKSDDFTETTGGGAIFASSTDLDGRPIEGSVSAPEIYNNGIGANSALHGGGICLINSIRTDLGVSKVINNTLAANDGSAIYWSNTTPTIKNNVVAFNTWGLEQVVSGITGYVIQANDVYGNEIVGENTDYLGLANLTGIDGNISADPLLGAYVYGELHLQPGSPCINTGQTAAVEPSWTDIDGQTRIQGGSVDIGADESNGATWSSNPTVIRVKPGGNDLFDGGSWLLAKASVKSAIDALRYTGGEIWVAQGAYNERVTMTMFLHLYGGFAGTEQTRAERGDPAAHPTILNGSGAPNVVRFRDAGYRVSTLDGFTIQNGGVFTNGGFNITPVEAIGGGIYITVCSPDIRNNIIQNNSVGNPYAAYIGRGGGLGAFLSHSRISSNIFRDNEAISDDSLGGGVYLNLSTVTLTNNTFTRNHAPYGSAIHANVSAVILSGSAVSNNSMYDTYPLPMYFGSVDGAIHLRACLGFRIENNHVEQNRAFMGGGMSIANSQEGVIRNNIIRDNVAFDVAGQDGGYGGGIFLLLDPSVTEWTEISNNTIVDNTATHTMDGERGGGIALDITSDNIKLSNNLIAFNSSGIWRKFSSSNYPTLVANDVYGNLIDYRYLSAGPTDISVDPAFVDRAGGNLHIKAISPCINTGDPAGDYNGQSDMDDGPRVRYGRVDIGVDEVFPIAGDFEPDEDVDLADLCVWSHQWLAVPCMAPDWCQGSDFNQDGRCDLIDFTFLAAFWLINVN